jgi:hypothetical protein
VVVKNSKRSISKEIDLSKSKEYVNEVNKIINTEFIKIKNNFIKKFNQHPVTREIDAGPGASNISKTLSGEANLFSFIGFEKSENPTNNIRSLFSQIFINKVVVKRDGSALNVINYPTTEDYFQATPLPWAPGRSWAKGIEQGISGLGFFLKESHYKSRSGVGIQIKNKIRGIEFKPTQYLTSLIKDFEKDILILNSTNF